MTTPEPLASSWTITGGAQPHSDQEWSPLHLTERAKSAERAGFTGIGIRHADLGHAFGVEMDA